MAKPKNDPYIWGMGRRKTAIARVRLKSSGTGAILINQRKIEDYFPTDRERRTVEAPLEAVGERKTYDIFVNAHGGGLSGQAGAVALGIARALLKVKEEHEEKLREGRFLTRDSRQKERKKYGRRGARRGFQFSKR